MNRCVIGFVVALATVSSALAVAYRTAAQQPNLPQTVHSQRFDGCPYYPSPVTCRADVRPAPPLLTLRQ